MTSMSSTTDTGKLDVTGKSQCFLCIFGASMDLGFLSNRETEKKSKTAMNQYCGGMYNYFRKLSLLTSIITTVFIFQY